MLALGITYRKHTCQRFSTQKLAMELTKILMIGTDRNFLSFEVVECLRWV